MMTDENRKSLSWSVRYIESGTRDEMGYVIPAGWYVIGWEDGEEESLASLHVSQHIAGSHAAASLAAVTSHLLNGYEQARTASLQTSQEAGGE